MHSNVSMNCSVSNCPSHETSWSAYAASAGRPWVRFPSLEHATAGQPHHCKRQQNIPHGARCMCWLLDNSFQYCMYRFWKSTGTTRLILLLVRYVPGERHVPLIVNLGEWSIGTVDEMHKFKWYCSTRWLPLLPTCCSSTAEFWRLWNIAGDCCLREVFHLK